MNNGGKIKIEVNFAEKVNILGTDYAIEVVKEDVGFKNHPTANGFAEYIRKRIVLKDKTDYRYYKENPTEMENLYIWMQKTLRHEIVHAFLSESGLNENTKSNTVEGWARNEEMVDWFALQGPKIFKAWTDAGAL